MMTFLHRRHFLLTAALVLASVGCGRNDGPKLASVYGTVTLNGQPLPNATVHFHPLELGPPYSAGITNESGNYVLKYTREKKGAVVGEHIVTITTGNPNNMDEDGNPKPIPEILPAIYHKESTLRHQVARKSNEFNFDIQADLTPKKGKKKK